MLGDKKYYLHSNAVIFGCPTCGNLVVAFYVMPTSKRKICHIGTCTHCADKRTIFATLSCTDDEWAAMLQVPHMPILTDNREK